MIGVKETTESFVASIIVVLLNAIFHYALYRVTVALIILVKDQFACICPKIFKFYLPRDTNAALADTNPSLPHPA